MFDPSRTYIFTTIQIMMNIQPIAHYLQAKQEVHALQCTTFSEFSDQTK